MGVPEASLHPKRTDGILDRLLERVHRIDLRGDSMRRRGRQAADNAPEPDDAATTAADHDHKSGRRGR
jgi:hypothetical protein